MMKRSGGSLWVLGTVLSVSMAGARSAEAAPDWCKGAGEERVDFSLDRALKGDDVVWAVHDLVGAMCFPDGQAQKQMSELEAQHKLWSQKLEMNDADWADAAAWAASDQSSRYPSSTLRPVDPKQPWSTMSPVEQYTLLNYEIANHYDGNYIADALGPKLSEAGRLAYLLTICMNSNAREVQWAMCQPDLDAFDFKKLVAELRADKKASGYARFLIRLAAHQLLPEKLKERGPQIAAARAKDPAYAKMFELSSAARKQWEGLWKTEAALLDLALQMDDARVTNSRRALQGCDDKTWAAWKTAVGGIAAKKFGAVERDEYLMQYHTGLMAVVANDPRGYLAAAAHYTCGAAEEKVDPLIRTVGLTMERWPGHRGPRTSAHTAVLTAGLELDDRAAQIEYPDTHRGWFAQSGSSSGGGYGKISAVKPRKDLVQVDFAAKIEKQQQCLESKYTKRITQIRSDGSLVYELLCLKWGTVSVDRRSPTQNVKARYAKGLKPGMGVYIIEDAVIAAWDKPGSNVPSMIGGVPVK